VAVSRIVGMAGLRGFSYKKIYGVLPGQKITGRNNEVTVRRGLVSLRFLADNTYLNFDY